MNITRAAVAAVTVSALALSGCGAQLREEPATVDATATPGGSQIGHESLVLDNGAVSPKPAVDDGGEVQATITGTLRNQTRGALHITRFSSSLGEAEYAIHEVVDGQMRDLDDGIVIPGGGELELTADGTHFMVMDYSEEIPAGSTVDLVLEVDPMQRVVISRVPVRDMAQG